MVSLLDDVLRLKQDAPEKVFELCEHKYPGVFLPLLDNNILYRPWEKQLIITYILLAYTKNSPWLLLGREIAKQKEEIAEKIQLPDTLKKDVLKLKEQVIRDTIDKYLDALLDRDWKHYKQKEDIYDQLMSISITDMKDKEGKTDFKLLIELEEYGDRLLKELKAMEERMKLEYEFCDEAKKDIKKAREHNKSKDAALENSEHVKK